MPSNKPQPSSDESSSEDEEERARMAAIQSVAIESSAVVQSAATSKSKAQARRKGGRAEADGSDASEDEQNGGLKHYQLKAQDALHDFLDTTFGRLISDVGGTAASKVSPQSDAEDEGATNGADSNKDPPGIQLFGRLPKRKAPTESEKRAAESNQRRQKRHEKGREFDEDATEVRERLTSAAVETDIILKAAETAAQRAAAEAKTDEARRQKEMTDEGQRVAKLKRERGVAQLIKGRIVMVKEPVSDEVSKGNGMGDGGGEKADGIEGGKGKKKKKMTQRKEVEDDTEKMDTGSKAVEGTLSKEIGTIETPKKKKKKKKKKLDAAKVEG